MNEWDIAIDYLHLDGECVKRKSSTVCIICVYNLYHKHFEVAERIEKWSNIL